MASRPRRPRSGVVPVLTCLLLPGLRRSRGQCRLAADPERAPARMTGAPGSLRALSSHARHAGATRPAGRAAGPPAGVIAAQSLPAAPTVPNASRGWDNAKKVNGRNRHLAVDATGLLLEVLATPASVQDRDAARPLLLNLHRAHRRI